MKNYDLVIVGGGTAGCACAYIAAGAGLKTLLVEARAYLGGAITSQLVIPAMKTSHCDFNQVFFKSFIKNMNEKKAQITYCDGNDGWFNPFIAKEVLYQMLEEVDVDIRLNTQTTKINTNGRRDFTQYDTINYETKDSNNINTKKENESIILSVCFESKDNDKQLVAENENFGVNFENHTTFFEVSAKYFVDATGDATLFKLAKASLLPPSITSQAMSLRFVMAGVDKKAFADWIMSFDKDRTVTTACEIDGETHFSTAYTWDSGRDWALAPLFDKAVKENILENEDRAYFQLFSIAGMPDGVAFNCPRLFSEDINNASKEGLERITRLADFARKYLKGFESSHIYKIADSIGVRATRQIKGRYILTADDIVKGREFANPVAISDYPIDVHSLKKMIPLFNTSKNLTKYP